MDMGSSGEKEGKIGSEINRGVEPLNYHSPNNNMASDWRFITPNLSNHPLGEDSERDLMGSSSVSMVDSFSPAIWDQPNSSNNVQINATTSNSPLIRKGVPVTGWENPNMMFRGGAFLQLPQSLSQFPADSAFIERAARFSSFNNGNFSDTVPFSISNSLNPYSSDSARMQGPEDIPNLDALRADANKTELKMAQTDEDSNINHATTNGSPIKLDKETNRYLGSSNEKKYGTSMSNNQCDEREFSGGGEIEKQSILDCPSGGNSAATKGLGTKKRKKISQDTEIDQDKGVSPLLEEAAKGNNKSKEKVDQNQTSSTSKASGKMVKDGSQPSDAGKEDYIHVRARRGQATNSHSLAERVRREKISERMKFLQELVPGCNKVTGKAVMLDEIINYVQSLQRQVEFLSMKLAAVNPRLDLNIEGILAKDILMAQGGPSAMGFSPNMSMVHAQLHPSQQALLQGIPNMGNSLDILRRTIGSQLGLMGSGYKDLPQPANEWDDELHNVVQMTFDSNRHFNNQDLNDSLPPGQMKAEL